MKDKAIVNKRYIPKGKLRNLALNKTKDKVYVHRDGYISKIIPKSISRIRADISTWQNALKAADNIETPRRGRLYNLYADILLDAHLTSQIELRTQHVLSIPFCFKKDDKIIDIDITSSVWVQDLNRIILQTPFFGHSLVEILAGDDIKVVLIPRNNVVPEKGILLLREDDTKGILYREQKEYGRWVMEFGGNKDYGLLNKAVPHVLFKRFAQSCWSELCEIYAIPPRFMKTDTSDPEMLNRAEAMLRDMGSAAYFIIDTTETFEFAKGADTNGDVYSNLITLCRDELSMLVNGVVVGQDTKNGNRSKEESSIKLLDKIIQSDKRLLENAWNSTVIPALVKIGILPDGVRFELQQEEDIEKLWKMTCEAMPYMDVNPEWIKEKFGVDVLGQKSMAASKELVVDTSGFFD